MKNSNQKQFISILLLVLISAVVFFPVHAEDSMTVREVLTGMGELVPVQKTPYLLAKEKDGTKWGVYNTDGEELIPFAYASIAYLSSNCFEAWRYAPAKQTAAKPAPLEQINSHALVTADGTQVSYFLYGAAKAFSTYWACGWVLEEGSEEDYDYSIDSVFYRIQRCDIYYLGDHALLGKKGTERINPCLSLTREEFEDAKGHGKYLYVQDRQNSIKVYDCNFQELNVEVKKLEDPMYVIKNWAVIPRGTSEIFIDGFSAVEEVPTEAGLLLKVTRLDYSGNKWNSVFNLDGEQLMPLIRETISKVTQDYAVLTSDKLLGLYSLRENKVLVPCAFDKIIACETSLDPYLLHGYVCVQKEGTSYFLHVEDGKLFEVPSLNRKWKKTGAAYYLNDTANFRYRVLAPDQTECEIHNAKILKDQNRGSGYLLAFTSEIYGNMVANWYGKLLVKFNFYSLIITDDDKIIAPTGNNGYKLLEIIESE